MTFHKKNHTWSLKPGAHIAIVGGGPAGCFFAMHALRIIRENNLDLKLTVFDAKDFLLTGPPGCNLCVGVISENLVRILKKEGIYLDSPKIQRKIKGYYMQTPHLGVQLHHPQWIESIYSVFRGNGPRYSSPGHNISFDDVLLQHIIQKGIRHISEQVIDISISDDPDTPATLFTRDREGKKQYAADLVVGAFGLNSPLLKKL
jgi:2-polyprenyl-6-methoxyphenol hydroxylase-like FAD-dependent oxidoreductase